MATWKLLKSFRSDVQDGCMAAILKFFKQAPVAWWIRELTLNLLGFSPLWFEPRSGHMWESQVRLTDGQVIFFSGFSGFCPPLMNDRFDISEIFLKGL